MPLYNFQYAHLPYCLQKQKDGSYIALNREYKPIGFYTDEHVDYGLYPIAVKFKGLTAKTAARVSYKNSPNLEAIYLYNDSCVPHFSKKDMAAYLDRLAILAKLKIVEIKCDR